VTQPNRDGWVSVLTKVGNYILGSIKKSRCESPFDLLSVVVFVRRLPVLENTDDLNLEDSMNNVGSAMLSRFPRWFVLSHVETQQCQLAATLLAAAKSKS
jgi:hypothetical protein